MKKRHKEEGKTMLFILSIVLCLFVLIIILSGILVLREGRFVGNVIGEKTIGNSIIEMFKLFF